MHMHLLSLLLLLGLSLVQGLERARVYLGESCDRLLLLAH